MTDTSNLLLSAEDLSVTFAASDGRMIRAVDKVSFDLRRGETLALVGESGCGKSTTALAMMRLLNEDSETVIGGRVILDGDEMLRLPLRAMRHIRGRRMAMIFQEPMTSLNPVLTIHDQIAETIHAHERVSRLAARERVISLLSEVGIPEPRARADAYLHQLSGGMRQRVMIASALACDPELLIADEPTTALDVTMQAQILDLLRALMQKHGMGLLLITHDLGVVAETADRVAVMYAGRIVEEAAVGPFFAAPQHPYSQGLVLARPEAGHAGQRRLVEIPGRAIENDGTFDGCAFAARCPAATAICQDVVPPLKVIQAHGQFHRAACHHDGIAAWTKAAVIARPRSAGETTPMLSLQDLVIHYQLGRGRTEKILKAVDGVTIDVRRAETHALVGESGCGKSTVARSILGFVAATGGHVALNGKTLDIADAAALRAHRRACQIVFQDPFASLNPRLNIGASIAEPLENFTTIGASERRARVGELLERVGLSATRSRDYPHQFSGGQRQRICIARALALDPYLLVCDEPVSALDVSIQAQILNLLADLQSSTGVSILFITHDLAVVGAFADRVSVMYLGRIVETGTVAEIFSAPRHPYTSLLLASAPGASIDARRDGGNVLRDEKRRIGEPASLFTPPSGCAFHPRCHHATAECRRTRPPLQSDPLGRGFACHHPLN